MMLNLDSLQQFSFSDVIDLAASALSYEEKKSAWMKCKRGKCIYTQEYELNAYLHLYGKSHLERINRFLPSIPFHDFSKTGMAVIDWGCGQGLAAACTLDWLRQQEQMPKIHSVHLVEISDVARRRAQQVLSYYPEITHMHSMSWNHALTSLHSGLFPENIPIVHLFSNILDIEEIDLNAVAEVIKKVSETHPAYILSVSPNCPSCERLREFMKLLNVETLLEFSNAYLKRQPNGWRPTCYGMSYKLSTPHTTGTAFPIVVPRPVFDEVNLIDAAEADSVDEVIKLIDYGISIDARDENGFTPLIWAAKYNATETVKWLVAHGANINAQNEKGATALYFAAKYGHVEVLRTLLNAKADPEICTFSKRMTPYLIAAKKGQKEVMRELEKAGCNVLAYDSLCRTAELLYDAYAKDLQAQEDSI